MSKPTRLERAARDVRRGRLRRLSKLTPDEAWRALNAARAESRAITPFDVWGDDRDPNEFRSNDIKQALTLIAVYAATSLIANGIAGLPIQTFRRNGANRQQIANPALIDDPTIFGTVYEWVQRAMTSILLRGNAYGFITQFDVSGVPRHIEWLHPDDVSVLDNKTTARPDFFYLGRPIDPHSFVHIPGYVLPGQVLGLSPIAYAANTIEAGLLANKFGRDFLRNGNTPSGVLETDQRVDESQANMIQARFIRNARGRRPAVLGAGTRYRAITIMPNESQFLQTIQAGVNEVAAMYHIPAERIGGSTGSSRTYSNREQDSLDLVTYAFRPFLIKFEHAISRLLPGRQFIRFNIDALVRADLRTRYEAHGMALRDGWMSRDEVRRIEDLTPLPDGQGATYAPPPGTTAAPPAIRSTEIRAMVTSDDLARAERAIRRFFAAQRDALVAGVEFDIEAWNARLEPVLLDLGIEISAAAGRAVMETLGSDGEYDVDRTRAWLEEHAAGVAQGINEVTEADVKEALSADDPIGALQTLFGVISAARAVEIAQTFLTGAAGFGAHEGAQQSGIDAVKTWRVRSNNPRPSHAAISGETVPLDRTFSNGARWPGDSRLPADELARCNCELEISIA